MGIRHYAPGQMLTDRHNGVWQDAEALQFGTAHTIVVAGQKVAVLFHPWKHAVCQLAGAYFESMHKWFSDSLAHGTIRSGMLSQGSSWMF